MTRTIITTPVTLDVQGHTFPCSGTPVFFHGVPMHEITQDVPVAPSLLARLWAFLWGRPQPEPTMLRLSEHIPSGEDCGQHEVVLLVRQDLGGAFFANWISRALDGRFVADTCHDAVLRVDDLPLLRVYGSYPTTLQVYPNGLLRVVLRYARHEPMPQDTVAELSLAAE